MSEHHSLFPILGTRHYLPWAMVAEHEAQALSNHCGQDLQRLAGGGGLDWPEMLAVLEDRPYSDVALAETKVKMFWGWWEAARPAPERHNELREALGVVSLVISTGEDGSTRYGVFSGKETASKWMDTRPDCLNVCVVEMVVDCPEFGNELNEIKGQ